ncbi:MAG: sulfatase-like hydrolase/transferase [Lentisphaerales bacterium]|nr:sulfatase-like hydrolase/transferase [Lentisphaerales bacterium]
MYRLLSLVTFLFMTLSAVADKPNIILVMTDDQGWGQVGYMNHPLLKTPNLNAMAENGLRFNRFYASAPVCSPTRASVLTGRANDRSGVFSHGYALRLEEKTLPQALKKAGYATGHFGKWHLDGLRGAGVPVLKDDPHSPGAIGFDEWLTVTNFFDLNPLMGRKGEFEEFKGDSSEVIVDEAVKFIKAQKEANKPSFTVIWYGSPHNPFYALDKDIKPFKSLKNPVAQKHHAEIRAMDRSVGTLRKALRDMGIADNTLIWFNSDNGGLKNKETEIDSVGGLRDNKGSMYEGGIRVPGIIEWPAKIKGRITDYPSSTMDIMPTILDIVGLGSENMLPVVDGISIQPLFAEEIGKRDKPMTFHYAQTKAAVIDNNYKLLQMKVGTDKYELYDLDKDPKESKNLISDLPEVAQKMKSQINSFTASVKDSIAGKDYPNGIIHERTERKFWHESEEYKKYFDVFKDRVEYKRYQKQLSGETPQKKKKKK